MITPYFFRRTIEKVCTNATSDDVIFDAPVEHALVQVTRWAAEDETSAPDSIRSLVIGHGADYVLNSEESPAAATPYWDADGTVISDDERLVARFAGASVSDVLKLHVEGWVRPFGEETL
jgi:hypothetical protein